MKKRIVSLIMISIMLVTTTITSNAAYFTDVSQYLSNEYIGAINYVSDNGYMNGTGDGTFGVNTQVTRSVFVTVLYRYSGDTGTYTHPFTDVSSTAYYANAVGWAYENGISSGTSATKFSPNSTLTREQLVCMLKNYAVYKTQYTEPLANIVALYDDDDNISNFAIDAVNWGLVNYIIQPDNNRIGPKDIITRLNLAVYLHRYSIYIEGLDQSEEVFGFASEAENFSSTYYISDSDMELIDESLKAYYGTAELADSLLDIIYSVKDRENTGSCYGMAIAVALDKLGIVDFNKNFDTNKATMSLVSTPKNKSTVESIINVYHLSNYIPFIRPTYVNNKNTQMFKAGLTQFVSDVEENGVVVFNFFRNIVFGPEGHAIVAYDITTADNNLYSITAYDPKFPTTPRTITINIDQASCVVSGYYGTINEISYISDFSVYDNYFDFDGIYNNNTPSFVTNTPPINSTVTEAPAIIRTSSYNDYVIESEDIGDLHVANRNTSGDLEIQDQFLILGSNSDSVCIDEYTVGISNCYNLEYEENMDETVFEVYHDEYNTCVSATNVNRIMITNSGGSLVYRGGVSIYGSSEATFNVLYAIDDPTYELVRIEGGSNGQSSINFTDDNVELRGIDSAVTVTYIDHDTLTETTVTIPYTNSSFTVTYP